MCVRRDGHHIPDSHLDFSLLEKSIAEIKNWPHKSYLINLTGLSEPTLYPRLVESVVYVKTHLPYCRVRVITNGISLTPEISRGLILAGLDELIISLNGVNNEDYRNLCGIDAYETVSHHINKILELRGLLKGTSLRLNLNLKKHEGNCLLIQERISYWRSLLGEQDVVSVLNVLPMRGSGPVLACADHPVRYPCAHLWGEIKLDIDGNIYPCDGKVMDYNCREKSELILGNIRSMAILAAYRSDQIRRLRMIHLAGEFKKIPTCLACASWSIFPNYWLQNRMIPLLKGKWY